MGEKVSRPTVASAKDLAELERLLSEPGSGRLSKEFLAQLLLPQRIQRMRAQASRYAPALREPIAALFAAQSEQERNEAIDALVKARGGAPANDAAQRRALAAYRLAKENGGKVEAAIAAAMEAGGFSRGYVYELRKKQKWDSKPR